MSIQAALYHLTHYKYDRPVVLGPQTIRLRPAPHSRTRVISHSLKVSPANHFVNHAAGPLRQLAGAFRLSRAREELKIEVDLVADMTVYNPFDFFVEDEAETWPFDYPQDIAEDLSIYRSRSRPGRCCSAFSLRSRAIATAPWISSSTSMRGSQREIGYIIRMEPGVQTPEETLERASGSCRDSQLAAGADACGISGFAARFVSGYLIQLKPDLVSLDGPARDRS